MSNSRFACSDLFHVKDSKEMQCFLSDPEVIQKKAFFGDAVLTASLSALIHRVDHAELRQDRLVSLKTNYGSDESLSRFLMEGTDFSSLVSSDSISQCSRRNAVILKALLWESNRSSQKSLLSLWEWKEVVDQIVLWIQEKQAPQDLPKLLNPMKKRKVVAEEQQRGHLWDCSEPRNQHSGLDQVNTGIGWFGRRCILCGAFLVYKRTGKNSRREVLLGMKQCPSSPPLTWLASYRPSLETAAERLELLDVTRAQLIMWGFLDH